MTHKRVACVVIEITTIKLLIQINVQIRKHWCPVLNTKDKHISVFNNHTLMEIKVDEYISVFNNHALMEIKVDKLRLYTLMQLSETFSLS